VHHDGGFGHAETRPAIGLRNADTEPAIGGERAIKLLGKFTVAVALEPIIVAKARADFFDRGAYRLLELGKGEVDGALLRGAGLAVKFIREINLHLSPRGRGRAKRG
jgi:hypothetical protein